MMLIEWTGAARRDLLNILAYFAEKQEKDVGQMLVDNLFAATDLLVSFPNSGRPGRIDGTRELVVPNLNYTLVYKVADKVLILRVLHSRRLYS